MATPEAASSAEETSSHFSQQDLDFCRQLPRVELHAHLNGCVQLQTLRQLVQEQGLSLTPQQEDALASTGTRSLADCFQLFDIIHKITTTHAVITRITQEVVSDFEQDGCIYLELRTTPKARPECGMTKRSYVEAVLAGLGDSTVAGRRPMLVKLLLSIDRRETAEAAMETVELAAQFPGQVVGIDLSGNPVLGSWSTWQPALEKARQLGLKVTLHAAEVYAPEEMDAMLEFEPDRLGHCCKLDERLEAKLVASGIPVELCLTSNLKTCTVPTYADHHFLQLHSSGCPVVLCTDDSGFFATSLSQEYAIAMHAFKLTCGQMVKLVQDSIGYAFCSPDERNWLVTRAGELLLQAAASKH